MKLPDAESKETVRLRSKTWCVQACVFTRKRDHALFVVPVGGGLPEARLDGRLASMPPPPPLSALRTDVHLDAALQLLLQQIGLQVRDVQKPYPKRD